MDNWQVLRVELEREAETILASFRELVIVTPDPESNSIVTLVAKTRSMKLTWVPEKDAVKWELPDEYGFERMPKQMASLARALVQRLRH